MKALKSFTINFASLADGEHLFDYQINNKFLKHFEAALVQEGDVDVKLSLTKFLDSLEFNFEIQGTVLTACDVCAETFDFPIEGTDQVLVKIVHEIPEQEDEFNIIYLKEGTSSINIAEMLYELLMLSIPMRTVHPVDNDGNYTCDPAVLKYLESNEDTEASDEEANEGDSINPIWDELKKLK
ncbi:MULTISPECIES: DUF177 domain-containing protein [unclassified Aureispira]|uniref:YceD family protein n=1 Tax=unclassified Aureispira TaxID=2649989 RepID=UPI000698AB34|nr:MULTISPECIES: DUF177 domain-containing protein [unclassified Aureispira]WMX14310.1 DUF177 domain-containing protein [Aureispira sp. CCB-E]